MIVGDVAAKVSDVVVSHDAVVDGAAVKAPQDGVCHVVRTVALKVLSHAVFVMMEPLVASDVAVAYSVAVLPADAVSPAAAAFVAAAAFSFLLSLCGQQDSGWQCVQSFHNDDIHEHLVADILTAVLCQRNSPINKNKNK